MGQKSSDWCAIPLCWECHQGKQGWHGDRTRAKLRNRTEMGMLGETIAQVLRMQRGGALRVRSVSVGDRALGLPGTPEGCGSQGEGEPGGTRPVYLGEAWLRAAKHDWARFTLHPEHLADGNPFDGGGVPTRYMLAAIPLQDDT